MVTHQLWQRDAGLQKNRRSLSNLLLQESGQNTIVPREAVAELSNLDGRLRASTSIIFCSDVGREMRQIDEQLGQSVPDGILRALQSGGDCLVHLPVSGGSAVAKLVLQRAKLVTDVV